MRPVGNFIVPPGSQVCWLFHTTGVHVGEVLRDVGADRIRIRQVAPDGTVIHVSAPRNELVHILPTFPQ